jgi:fibro-slime domain-containing protein
MYWENMVVYTPGMVNPYLTFDTDSSGTPLYLEGAHIHKLGELCDNVNFNQWFEDVSGVNKRSNLTLDIPTATDNPKYKELDYNYNNGGYFPLDVIDIASQMRLSATPGSEQWGPQSFSIFCPPYGYQYASTQVDFMDQNTYGLCSAWNAAGGARALSSSAAETIAEAFGVLGKQHLRNYHYTSENFARFIYNATNESFFEVGGDDDIWVFVDGVLVIDLGGTHLPTAGLVSLKTLAENNHGCHDGEPLATVLQGKNACGSDGQWADGSEHYLHIFHANRQTEGTDFYFRVQL